MAKHPLNRQPYQVEMYLREHGSTGTFYIVSKHASSEEATDAQAKANSDARDTLVHSVRHVPRGPQISSSGTQEQADAHDSQRKVAAASLL